MHRILHISALCILTLSAYGYGVLSLRYNLFPIHALKEIREFTNQKSLIPNREINDNEFEFMVTKLSYYQLDTQGMLIIDESRSNSQGTFYAVGDKKYNFTRRFSPSDTAIVIMDAWADSGTAFLNEIYTPIYRESILPLVEAFNEKGFTQYAFTNEESDAGYGEELFAELEALIDSGDLLKRLHSNNDVEKFETELRQSGISNIIYLGFASNMCIIGRRVGMFSMQQRGFNTYFVPESSAAVETGEGWNSGQFHTFTTSLIQHNFQGTISKSSILTTLASD